MLDPIFHCGTRLYVRDNCLHQDNKSFIILEKNGKAMSSKITKHINIWYLFITDRVKNGEVWVVLCPTGDFIGNYMIKHLQDAMFSNFKDKIMGVIPGADPGPGKFKVEQIRKS